MRDSQDVMCTRTEQKAHAHFSQRMHGTRERMRASARHACLHRFTKEVIKCKQDAQATWAIGAFTSSSMTRTLSAGGGEGGEVGGGGGGEAGEGEREREGRSPPRELMRPERSISYVEIPIAKNVADLHGVLTLVFIFLLFFSWRLIAWHSR